MTSIPGFWDIGPHEQLPVEPVWNEFVGLNGGQRVNDLLSGSPSFENADYLFVAAGVVVELKEVQTEFGNSTGFRSGFDKLMKRVVSEDPNWRPLLFGGSGEYPKWFYPEYVRLFRPHVSRVLKKANRQLRETKEYFGIPRPTGVLLLVNDGFTELGSDLVRALACNLLANSYSSIDCLVYLTVNRYVEIQGSDVPRLVWAPTYSDRCDDALSQFIDDLGRRWFKYLETKIGPFTIKDWEIENHDILKGSKTIVLPKHRD